MLHLSGFQISQIMTITIVFILHLLTFYDLTFLWGINMVMVETPIYGIYFIIKLAYLVAVLTDGTFTPPLEAMLKLYGAVLYNVLGLVTLLAYQEYIRDENLSHYEKNFSVWLMVAKGICSIVVAIFYYAEVFQA